MTEEQFAKLPKWAQQEFGRLQRDLQAAREINEQHLAEYADPKFPAYGDYDELRGRSLPCRQVWFRNAGITVRADGDAVHVSGDGRLTITPHVTNAISLRSDRIDKQP